MTHQEIQTGEIIERYVRHQLAPDERRSFQEHFFSCDDCFEQVQMMARFVAGVRQAARQGALADGVAEPATWRARWFRPAFGFMLAAVLILIIALSWFLFRRPAGPELANQQQPGPTPEQPVTPEPNSAPDIAPGPETNAPPKPPDQRPLIAQQRPPEAVPGKAPVVLLESSRDASAGGNQLLLPANVNHAILRIEVEPGSPFAGFQFQVFDGARRLVTTAVSGKASPRGAVAVRVPAGALQDGKYLVKCYGVMDGRRELIGEYDLHVRRP